MESLVRCARLRRSSVFWGSTVLIMAALFSWSMPTLALLRSGKVRSGSGQHDKTTKTITKQSSTGRWIEVNLSQQRLIAWEGGRRVYSIPISTGKRSTPTPTGTFAIESKERSAHMRGRDYNVPNVPNTMYFAGGYAIHGAYWHNQFGTPVSHGCINLPVGQSRKLFNWADEGTRVVVHG